MLRSLTYEHVRRRQRRDEVIARLPDVPVDDKRQQHQNVTANR